MGSKTNTFSTTRLANLSDKYDNERPRRILSLDGGGILGIISLQILKKIETDLKTKLGTEDDFRLGDFFDYIGGTSTGAIIASGLALGMSVDELIDFYENFGEIMFKKANLLMRLRAKHTSKPLEKKLKEVIGEQTKLGSNDLKCLLGVITQNATTNSPWSFTNNPFAKYNDPSHPFDNYKVPLWKLVRASTAAPTFFLPEEIFLNAIDPDQPFYFVDGGVTPYNNPAFHLFRLATAHEFGLKWNTGEDKMMILSIGTSSGATGDKKVRRRGRPLFRTARMTPSEMMRVMSYDQDFNCRVIGRCVFGPQLDREVDRLIPSTSGKLDRKFLYARYNPIVDKKGLEMLGFTEMSPEKFSKMNDPSHLNDMIKVGKKYAEKHVNLEPFEKFIF